MSRGPRYRVPFRRRREGLTDYRHRLKLLKSGVPRAVVRRSNGRFWVAVTQYDPAGDRVIASADSKELPRLGFPGTSLTSTPAAYLTGYLAGLRAKNAGTSDAVLDLGLRHAIPGGRVLGALKGLLDAGIEIPHGEKGFPGTDRLNGKHLGTPLPEPLETYRLKLPSIAAKAAEASP
jgi:large subunit ribosomal protein L18